MNTLSINFNIDYNTFILCCSLKNIKIYKLLVLYYKFQQWVLFYCIYFCETTGNILEILIAIYWNFLANFRAILEKTDWVILNILENSFKILENYWKTTWFLESIFAGHPELDRDQHKQSYKDLSKHIHKRFNELRTHYYQNMANQFSEPHETCNIEKKLRISKQKMS